MLRKLLANHVLANIFFAVVLIIGALAYGSMPRSKDPEINFNWISVFTVYPGASAEDVEKLVTAPLEEAIQKLSDLKFVSSNSREGVSSILIRFQDIDDRTFDRRLNDLRREIQNKANDELPEDLEDPLILEITTANSFPTATVMISGEANDERLRSAARNVEEDLQRISGVDDVDPAGLHEPELQVDFSPDALAQRGITPAELADDIAGHFRDTALGDAKLGDQTWLIRLIGTNADPDYLARLPLSTNAGRTPISAVADVGMGRRKAEQLVLHKGKPAVMFAITKRARINTLQLVDRIRSYVDERAAVLEPQGLRIALLDDQTAPTRHAISVMEGNFVVGLALVMLVTWFFLGWHISLFIGLGIPFALAGTFSVLSATGFTLNEPVLLGIVIVIGMLVDDAIVVVESIYHRLQQGMDTMRAAVESLHEVFAPVTSSVATTIAAFLPLMLMPGILGQFMRLIPLVVTIALLVSLLEAYWMLPVHVNVAKLKFDRPSAMHRFRIRFTRRLRLRYSQALVKVLRRPRSAAAGVIVVLLSSVGIVAGGLVKIDFFASDALRLFYINVQMPPGTPLEDTLAMTRRVEEIALRHVDETELRDSAAVAGQMFTLNEPFFGDQFGQVTVTLRPQAEGARNIQAIIDAMRSDVLTVPGPTNLSFMLMTGGPPVNKPINVKVRGDDYAELRRGADAIRNVLASMPAIRDIIDDDSPGKMELRLSLDTDAVNAAGLNVATVTRSLRLLFDGDIVARMQHQNEKLEVRVRAKSTPHASIDAILRTPLALPDGRTIALGSLTRQSTERGKNTIRHYNFRRTITVEADIDKAALDTVTANKRLQEKWRELRQAYPGVDLEFSGELDDIQESLDAMIMLSLLGVGLIYLILGTQFRSYWQPFMILATLPMAFCGVVIGLAMTRDPLSLFTLYGVVALAGVAVNAAIVMIDAANVRLYNGMSVLHAAIYAARRRLIPILITSLTTIAGLLSLAAGWGGRSLVWSPVAASIVWGLAISTLLTLFLVPLLYRLFMRPIRS